GASDEQMSGSRYHASTTWILESLQLGWDTSKGSTAAVVHYRCGSGQVTAAARPNL
ncbi:hypothetical protein HAX54_050056, partial [Datura stramonium]|nr:hypothetical protein [Datura stramonium]